MAIARADREAGPGILVEGAAAHADAGGAHAEEEPRHGIAGSDAVLETGSRAARAGVHAIAAVGREATVADADVAAHLEAQAFAVILTLSDSRDLEVAAPREVDRATAAAVHPRIAVGVGIAHQDEVAHGGVPDPMPEKQREGCRQHGLLVGRVVGLDAVIQAHPAGFDPGEAGKGAVEAAPLSVVDGHGHPRQQPGAGGQRHIAHAVVVVTGERVDAPRCLAQHRPLALTDQLRAGAQFKPAVQLEVEGRQDESPAAGPGHGVDSVLNHGRRLALRRRQA